MKHALILGGGFAGVSAATELHKSKKFRVTLVSSRDYLYIYPLSIWVPVHQARFEDIRVPLSEITKAYPFEVIVDNVEEIRAASHEVRCSRQTLGYDYLVVAFGADKMKHKGIENTLSICGKPEISVEIMKGLDSLVEKGGGSIAIGFGGNPKDSSAVRGGPAFELIFNIHHMLKKRGIRQNFNLTFFAPMASPGARMGGKSMEMVNRMFSRYNIGRRYGKKITEFEKNAVVFEDGSKLDADLILFIPASAGNSVLEKSDLPLSEAGFISIDDTCNVKGLPDVYAAGDITALKGPDWQAKQGHIAELMGRNAAFNIISSEEGLKERKGYLESINILCVMDTGNGAAFVFRNSSRAFVIPLPVVGHWMKKGWGVYTRLTKKGLFPRLPGL